MAKRQVVSYNYSCDVCGGMIPESAADSATRKFSWEGSDYVVDVCAMHATELDEVLSQLKTFAAAGQRSSGRRGRRPSATTSSSRAPRGRRAGASVSTSTSPKRDDLSAVRAWARESGRSVSERGRIPASLLAEYDTAHSTTAAPVSEAPAASDAAAPATITATPRATRRRSSGPTAKSSSGSAKRSDLSAVRAWARENGQTVSERGRIPASLLAAYDAAQDDSAASDEPAAPEAPRKRTARKSAPARKRAARKAGSVSEAE